MRLNQFLARHTELSRRSADKAVTDGRVEINGVQARLGDTVIDSDRVTLDGASVKPQEDSLTVLFHKPAGVVVSRDGQGSKTIYDVLPSEYQGLNPVGRLDKDSSGLLVLTNDGQLANQLTHPRYEKQKVYKLTLDKPLHKNDESQIKEGVVIDDLYLSRLEITDLSVDKKKLTVTMSEGKNRQIRRTFSALGYKVVKLHRTQFGSYQLGALGTGECTISEPTKELRN